jgi:hypothetical protein
MELRVTLITLGVSDLDVTLGALLTGGWAAGKGRLASDMGGITILDRH